MRTYSVLFILLVTFVVILCEISSGSPPPPLRQAQTTLTTPSATLADLASPTPPPSRLAGKRLLSAERPLWRYKTHDAIESSPTLAKDGATVYVGSDDGSLYSLDAKTGSLRWRFHTSDPVASSPALSPSGDVVYVGCDDHNLYAINVTDGTRLWSSPTGGQVYSSPAVSADGRLVFVGSYDKSLYAIASSTGEVVWSFPTGDVIRSSPSLSPSGEAVYIGSWDQHVYCVDAVTGHQLWNISVGRGTATSCLPSPDGDRVFVGPFNGLIYALDAWTGSTIWQYQTDGGSLRPPALSPDGGSLFIGSFDHSLYALNASTGALLWSFATGSSITCTPVVSPGGEFVYFGSSDANVYALYTATGAPAWVYTTEGDIVSSPKLSHDGRVLFIGSNDHYIYALQTPAVEEVGWVTLLGLVITLAATTAGGVLWVWICVLPRKASDRQHPPPCRSPNSLPRAVSRRSHMVVGNKIGVIHRGVLFYLGGAIFGLLVGSITFYVAFVLHEMIPLSKTSDYQTKGVFEEGVLASIFGYNYSYSCTILVSALEMALVWSGWALASSLINCQLLVHLPAFCCAVSLASTLMVSFHLVPCLWVIMHPGSDRVESSGSRPQVFLTWLAGSYPAGYLVMVVEILIMDGIFKTLEWSASPEPLPAPWRVWRGHSNHHFLMVLHAYRWGFLSYWTSVAIAVYLFNKHKGFVPPYTPLWLLGLSTGLLVFLLDFLQTPSPSDRYYPKWYRQRVHGVRAYLESYRCAHQREVLLDTWKHLANLRRWMRPGHTLRLLFNRCCPCEWRLSRRASLWLDKIWLPASHATLEDEMDLHLLAFAIRALTSVAPLILYWFYQRFGSGRELYLAPPFTAVHSEGPRGEVLHYQTDILPIPVSAVGDGHYFPLAYGNGTAPLSRCPWDRLSSAFDYGDFNLCPDPNAGHCSRLDTTCSYSNCTSLLADIQGEPSCSLWFNMQLVVYGGFLLYAVWVIMQETEEKLYVSVAFKLQGVYHHADQDPSCWWRSKTPLLNLLLFGLGCLYAACLFFDSVKETFIIYSSVSIYMTWPESQVPAAVGISTSSVVLSWYCEALDSSLKALVVTYKLEAADDVVTAVLQGLYFFYQLWALRRSQSLLYDFIDVDVLMTQPQMECPLWRVLDMKKSHRLVHRADVEEYLHDTVYQPFLREVHRLDPDLIPSLFNEWEALLLIESICDGPPAVESPAASSSYRVSLNVHKVVASGDYLPVLRRVHHYYPDIIHDVFCPEEADLLTASIREDPAREEEYSKHE